MDPQGSDPYPATKRVRVSGWNNLPSNQAQPLMQALVNEGPAVVAVDANNWFDYSHGIFDDCEKDATLVHAVLAKGYGAENGKKYWQIQNSWGAGWGEAGDIRVLRHDDEDQYCGTDRKPEEGLGCEGGPKEITVCGTCGILYDPVIPQGVRIEDGDASAAIAAAVPFRPATTAAPQPPQQADFDLPGPQGLNIPATPQADTQAAAQADTQTDVPPQAQSQTDAPQQADVQQADAQQTDVQQETQTDAPAAEDSSSQKGDVLLPGPQSDAKPVPAKSTEFSKMQKLFAQVDGA